MHLRKGLVNQMASIGYSTDQNSNPEELLDRVSGRDVGIAVEGGAFTVGVHPPESRRLTRGRDLIEST